MEKSSLTCTPTTTLPAVRPARGMTGWSGREVGQRGALASTPRAGSPAQRGAERTPGGGLDVQISGASATLRPQGALTAVALQGALG